jgi:hypothetical protein
MYNSLGVRYLFLAAYETPEGLVNTGIMDFNDDLGGGAAYMAKNANWNMEGIDMDSWNHHNRDYYNSEQIPASISSTKLPSSLIRLEQNEFGEPILPNPSQVPKGQTSRKWRQGLVRAFMTHHYCKSSESKLPQNVHWLPALASASERPIPWKKLLPRIGDCVEEEHLPAHLLSLLGEPSTMKDDQCYSLLGFWYTRQTTGLSPTFRFKKYLITDDLVEALPRERADIPQMATPPIASGSNQAAPARGNGPEAKKKGKSKRTRKQHKGKGKAAATQSDSDEFSGHSTTVSSQDAPARGNGTASKKKGNSKRIKQNKGKGKARATGNNSDESGRHPSSNSCSDSTPTATSSGDDTDSSTDSDSAEEQSRGPINNFQPNHTQVLFPTGPFNYSGVQPTLRQSHVDVDPVSQLDEPSGDENMFSMPIPGLGPELRNIERMLEKGLPREEILQAFSSMTVRSQSQSPLKPRSRGLSPPTDLGKRRGRPSTEGLPPASPTKKSRLQSLESRPDAIPHPPTTSLPDSLHPSGIVMQPPSLTDKPSLLLDAIECTPNASSSTAPLECTPNASSSAAPLECTPNASFSTASQARGAPTATISQGGGRKGQTGKKEIRVSSPRVTRSSAPKKRSTRANPN